MRRPRQLAALLALAAASACGNGDGGATTSAEGGRATADPTATVGVARTALGDVLVDGEGRTLYLFTRDQRHVSACAGTCASTWPPLVAGGDLVAGDGLDDDALSTFDREDGSRQVAYRGVPLYRYVSDQAPGETKGQGVGGVWFVVGPDGEAIEEVTDAQTRSY